MGWYYEQLSHNKYAIWLNKKLYFIFYFYSNFFQLCLGRVNKSKLYTFRLYNVMFSYIYTLLNMYIFIPHQVNWHICNLTCLLLSLCWKYLRSILLENFKHTLLFTIIILYIRALELNHLLTESLYFLTNISPFSPSHWPWQPPFCSLLLWVFLSTLRVTYKWDHAVFVSVLTYFT